MIRLAGVMAMVDDIHRETIPRKYMENAIALIEYYLNERIRVSGMAAPNLEIENAKTLLSWIQERGLQVGFTHARGEECGFNRIIKACKINQFPTRGLCQKIGCASYSDAGR